MTEIPKVIARRLAIAKPADHPDPNLLGAFSERSLGERERVRVLGHLSECTSCREIVALSATRPDIADIVSVSAVSPGSLSWPVLGWAAAVACVMVVGAVVTLRQKPEAQHFASMIAGENPTLGAHLPLQNSTIGKNAASLPVPAAEAKTAFAGNRSASRQKGITANPAVGNYAAMTPGPVEMADARTGSPFAEVPGRAKDAAAGAQDPHLETSATLSRKRPVMSGTASDALLPANLAPRWTLGSDGTLHRSLDSGGTWQTIVVSSKAVFRALAANGLDIWVGGSAGALFHSSDAGQHWTQVTPAANGEVLGDDIIGVEFTDTLHGKLTSSVEETWITADAGETWQKR